MKKQLITVKQYADKIGVSTTWVYKLIKEKKIKPVIIANHKFIEI